MSPKEDYINMHENSAPENAYDIYETAASLEQKDENKCPYTGLPAAHLKIMNSIQVGLLTRIEKKLFFAQSKDFYAGILEKWILLYPSKSNDMKPSECFFPKSVESEKGENQFNVTTNAGKRFHFQAPNADEFNDWIQNIQKIIDDNENCQLRELQSSQLSFRKLPSPPPGEENLDSGSSSENYYGFNRSSNQTVINNDERLYEVPCSANRSTEVVIETETVAENPIVIVTEAIIETVVESPPTLPAKTGRKSKDNSMHAYDVPKPTKIITDESLDLNSISQSPSPSPSPEPTAITPETPDKARTKVSEMTAMLSSINLVSPEERKSSHNPKPKKIQTPDKSEPERCEKRMSPVKHWFSKQISKSKKRLSRREKSPDVDEENEEPSSPVKGSKVNMIINQLERNGQLKVLSKSLKNRKSSAYEGEDYETVCVRN